MARSSTAVLRAAAILEYIAAHPGQSFTLAELVRALKLSHSTCHSLLAALVQVGYLYRTTDRGYVLGSGLAAIGRQATDCFSLLEIARPELRQLAVKHELISSALVRDGERCVVLERSASGPHIGFATQTGTAMKLRAPLAALFFAKSPDAAEEWLSRFSSEDKVIAAEREFMMRAIEFFQQRGFLALMINPDAASKPQTLEHAFEGDINQLPVTVIVEIEENRSYSLSSIIAPVYGNYGDVEYVISLFGYTSSLTGKEISELGSEVRDACARISSFALTPEKQSKILPL